MGHSETSRKWICLGAAVLLLSNVVQGLTTGRATLFYQTVTRSEDGYLFWIAVWSSAILGVAGVLVVML